MRDRDAEIDHKVGDRNPHDRFVENDHERGREQQPNDPCISCPVQRLCVGVASRFDARVEFGWCARCQIGNGAFGHEVDPIISVRNGTKRNSNACYRHPTRRWPACRGQRVEGNAGAIRYRFMIPQTADTARATASAASVTSTAVVSAPSVNRTAVRARSSATPIAVSTCDGSSLPAAHADPLEQITPSRSSSSSTASPLVPGNTNETVPAEVAPRDRR